MTPACFYCGVDSTELIWFLALIVGAGVLSLVCFILWGISTGHLGAEKHLADAPLRAERAEGDEVDDE